MKCRDNLLKRLRQDPEVLPEALSLAKKVQEWNRGHVQSAQPDQAQQQAPRMGTGASTMQVLVHSFV